ncbi:MAG: hypothetical protein H7831_18195 [Magnetococcus sp. WYHC-3]
MEFIKKAYYWLKAYWKLPAIVILVIVSFLFLRKSSLAVKLLEDAQESYQRQLDMINRLNEEEKKKREELRVQYEATLELLQLKYDKDKQILTEKEKEKVKQIVEQYKNDPSGLNNRLAEEFGLNTGG